MPRWRSPPRSRCRSRAGSSIASARPRCWVPGPSARSRPRARPGRAADARSPCSAFAACRGLRSAAVALHANALGVARRGREAAPDRVRARRGPPGDGIHRGPLGTAVIVAAASPARRWWSAIAGAGSHLRLVGLEIVARDVGRRGRAVAIGGGDARLPGSSLGSGSAR